MIDKEVSMRLLLLGFMCLVNCLGCDGLSIPAAMEKIRAGQWLAPHDFPSISNIKSILRKAPNDGTDELDVLYNLLIESKAPIEDSQKQQIVERAVKGVSPMATHNLALLYITGQMAEEQEPDEQKAFGYLEISASQDCAQSQYYLGKLRQEAKHIKWAIEFYLKAAEKEHGLALFQLGNLTPEGDEKLKYYERARKCGVKEACRELGRFYYNLGSEKDRGLIEDIRQEYGSRLVTRNPDINFREALQYYEELDKYYQEDGGRGDLEAVYFIALLNQECVTPKDPAKAAEYYRLAIDLRSPDKPFLYPDAYYRLARLCEQGYVNYNEEEMIQWYEQAVELKTEGAADAAVRLAQIHGNREAAEGVGEGEGAERQDNRLSVWYNRKAAEWGNSFAQAVEGVRSEKSGDILHAVKQYQRSAEQGEPMGCYLLGRCYRLGRGVEKNEDLAEKWLRDAVSKDCYNAAYELGWIYYNKKSPRGYKDAARYWKLAADNTEITDAQYQYGCLALEGLGVQRSEPEARHYFNKAAENGHFRAQCRLLFMSTPRSCSFNFGSPNLGTITEKFTGLYASEKEKGE